MRPEPLLADPPPDAKDEATKRPATHPRITPVSETYRAFAAQLQDRIRRLGLPMWRCDDLSGLQDGYTAKLLHPDTPSGRQATWATLDLLMGALFPDGYSIVIKPHDGSKARRLASPQNPTVAQRDRAILQKYGRMGGLKSGEVRRARKAAE